MDETTSTQISLFLSLYLSRDYGTSFDRLIEPEVQ